MPNGIGAAGAEPAQPGNATRHLLVSASHQRQGRWARWRRRLNGSRRTAGTSADPTSLQQAGAAGVPPSRRHNLSQGGVTAATTLQREVQTAHVPDPGSELRHHACVLLGSALATVCIVWTAFACYTNVGQIHDEDDYGEDRDRVSLIWDEREIETETEDGRTTPWTSLFGSRQVFSMSKSVHRADDGEEETATWIRNAASSGKLGRSPQREVLRSKRFGSLQRAREIARTFRNRVFG